MPTLFRVSQLQRELAQVKAELVTERAERVEREAVMGAQLATLKSKIASEEKYRLYTYNGLNSILYPNWRPARTLAAFHANSKKFLAAKIREDAALAQIDAARAQDAVNRSVIRQAAAATAAALAAEAAAQVAETAALEEAANAEAEVAAVSRASTPDA